MKTQNTLILTVNPWTLLEYPTARDEWDMDRKLAFFRECGCEAATLPGEGKETAEMLKRHDLRFVGFLGAKDVGTLETRYLQQVDSGAEAINSFLGSPETPLEDGIELLVRMHELEERHSVPIHIETHRFTMTEFPDFAWRLFSGAKDRTGKYPRVCWDHSHIAVVKHRSLDEMEPLLRSLDEDGYRRSAQMHLRPFNGHHAQIPVTDGKGNESPEFTGYMAFAEKEVGHWLAAREEGGDLWVAPELGPVCHGYGLSVFPDVAGDFKYLAGRIREVFKA